MNLPKKFSAHSKGFTIYELMLTLALMAVFVTVGVPSFASFMERNQLTTGINQFVSSLSLARSEAIKRNQRVNLCASSDGEQCSDGGYEDGWIVYVDNNQNNTRDNDEELLWVGDSYPANLTLRVSSNFDNSNIAYLGSGRINEGGNVKLCMDNDVKKARMLNLINTGRVRLAKYSNDGIPLDSLGDVISDCNIS